MDPNTPQPSSGSALGTPLPESVTNALMSIQPRYNSFHQHHAMPHMTSGNSYNPSPGQAPGSVPGTTSNSNNNNNLQPATTSVINLSNSSDVVIGPMTQYQGSVTIYQYMDATVEATRIASGRNNQSRGLPSPEHSSVLRQERYFLYGALILFTIIAFSTALYFVINQSQSNSSPSQPEILFGNNYVSGTIPNLGNGHLVIDRQNWGAQSETRGPYPLQHPTPYVLITHIGVQSTPCVDMYRCSIKMRTIQDAAVAEQSLPDISNNFYLGGDGFIYVGRGWDTANAYANHTLSVCFMGDYVRYEPNDKQFSALDHLLAHGVAKDYLTKDYKLVAHNQTRTTRSPGPYIYERISKLPRWSPCGTPGYSACGAEIGLPTVWAQDYPKKTVTSNHPPTVNQADV